ncbi:MAG TPA: UDP-N-acetylglucosamine 2-epimerase (non-hydrolyzing), partial [Candidatus Saccharimonadales bacterium]|nr:UDP-N-acetylglucosamine 2-epimerase (non-hydrolyzing) [Candidatus Saccharimonadales bacterium]
MRALRVATVFGTRPEAIKLAPVLMELKRRGRKVRSSVIVTAQHREMLDQVLRTFRIRPGRDLNLMKPGQSPGEVMSRILTSLDPVLETVKPDVVVVQGDTATTFAAAMAAFLRKIPVAHVEAGLRTSDIYNPFPEEMSRRLASSLSTVHFAPTTLSRDNLLAEGVDRRSIVVTGNTVIDALFWILENRPPARTAAGAWGEGRMLLVTTHRRENFNRPLRNICRAILRIVSKVPDLQVVLPLHRNPNVDGPVRGMLEGRARITLLPPLDYIPFVHLMGRAHLILTDSGGVQEEAPSLGIPVLVARRTTERPEGIRAGVCRLVGTESEVIEREALRLLRSPR